MPTLRRIAAILTFPAIAYLAAACERTDTPTEARPNGLIVPLAATCSVPSLTYPTIQSAVNDPACTTIIVAPGAYIESVTIGRPLTLLGPNAGTSWSGTRGPEAIVSSPSPSTTFNLTNGQDVTIDGFTILGNLGFGFYVSGSTAGTVIQNNIVTGTTRAGTLDAPGSGASVLNNDLISNIRSLHVSGGPYTDMKINGNRFSGPAATTGIFFSGALSNSITGFEFENNQVLHHANLASTISGGTVSGNTFNVASPGSLNLQIDLHNSTVTANTFEGNNVTACLQLFGSQFGLVPSDHVTVSGNTFNHCNVYGIQLSPDVHHITITNNAISNGFDGVNTRFILDDNTGAFVGPWDVTGKEIHINFNNLTGNAEFGVKNLNNGILDAECNWWGAADGPGPVGPGSGDKVSTNVDFTPWLTAPAPGGKCIGGLLPSGGQVTGGGQVSVNVTGGTGSFGFSANAARQSGHLDYMNHATRAHLNCTVNVVTILPGNMAHLEGMCANSDAPGFKADVQDNGTPGKNKDTFKITYTDQFGLHVDEGGPGPIIRGNIEIH
jgi:parallel beta-helix repeat protein